MTSRTRPLATAKRPLSAIFIGQQSSHNSVPDLPEPPSPGADSTSSGLPSPPATNSTGSGKSTEDDDDTPNEETNPNPKQRPLSTASSSASTIKGSRAGGGTNMLNGTYEKTFKAAFRGQDVEEEEEEADFEEQGEDDTARLNLRNKDTKNSSENILALQRVKNLAQRNRLVRFLLLSWSYAHYFTFHFLVISAFIYTRAFRMYGNLHPRIIFVTQLGPR
jgi:hypothetical protein